MAASENILPPQVVEEGWTPDLLYIHFSQLLDARQSRFDADAAVREHAAAVLRRELDTATDEREKSAAALRLFFTEQIDSVRREVSVASEEREKAAQTLSHQKELAEAIAADERERAASSLRDSLREQIRTGDENLRQHIDAQKESFRLLSDSSEKAILKAETANEKRFESVNEFRAQLRDQQGAFLSRELFDQARADERNREDAVAGRVEQIANRMTTVESVTLGKKDLGAEFRATIAIMIAGSVGAISIAIALLHH